MRRLLVCAVSALFPAFVRAQAPTPAVLIPNVVQSVVPSANSDGSISTLTTMTNGSQVTATTTPINNVAVTSYLPNATTPAALTLTNNATLALPVNPTTGKAYGVYYLSGSGIIVASTVQIPTAMGDGQFVRLVLPSGLTITTLTVQTTGSVTLGTVLTAVFGSPGLLYQMKQGVLTRAG